VITPLKGLDGGFGYGSALIGPSALSGDGTVVGTAYDRDSNGSAVVFTANRLVSLGVLGGQGATAVAVNNFGAVVGTIQGADGSSEAFMLRNGVLTRLGFLPGGTRSRALGINDQGQIIGVGNSSAAQGERGFLYDDGVMVDIGDLGGSGAHPYSVNRQGQIVGVSEGADVGGKFGPTLAFVYGSGQMRTLPGFGGPYTDAHDINSMGQVVGASDYPGLGLRHACVWYGDSISDLGALGGGMRSAAYAINDSGTIVGASEFTATGASTAFIYSAGRMFDLSLLVEPWNTQAIVFPNVNDRLLEADAIAPNGTILALSNSLGFVRLDPVVSGNITNFSLRGWCAQNNRPMTLGVILDGEGPGRVLVRAIGPGLAPFGISTPVAGATLMFYNGSTLLQVRDGWDQTDVSEAIALGAFSLAAGNADAAITQTIPRGVYTAKILPTDGAAGVGLLEAYVSRGESRTAEIVNGSGLVGLGQAERAPIAGFSVSGSSGVSILMRAVGKGLSEFGIPDGASAPQITLFDAKGSIVAVSTSGSAQPPMVTSLVPAVGAFTSTSAPDDAIIVASLRPGTYSAVISDQRSSSGTVLLELYKL
jgi:probable HAF family extracellular repeat protein